jgi:hypothetical protein
MDYLYLTIMQCYVYYIGDNASFLTIMCGVCADSRAFSRKVCGKNTVEIKSGYPGRKGKWDGSTTVKKIN